MSKKISKPKRRVNTVNKGEIKMSIKNWIIEKIVVGQIKPWYDKLEGKKTYVVMTVGILMAVVDVWNGLCGESISWCKDIFIPTWVFGVLFALGIYTRRVAK